MPPLPRSKNHAPPSSSLRHSSHARLPNHRSLAHPAIPGKSPPSYGLNACSARPRSLGHLGSPAMDYRGAVLLGTSRLQRSRWCCRQAPRACHLSSMILSWCFLLLICMPSLVNGNSPLRQDVPNSQNKHWFSVDVKARYLASRSMSSSLLNLSENLRSNKKLREPPPGGADRAMIGCLIKGRTVLQQGFDSNEWQGSAQARSVKVDVQNCAGMERHHSSDQGRAPRTGDSVDRSMSCSISTLSSLMGQISIEAPLSSGLSSMHFPTFQSLSASAPNVAIIPSLLKWEPISVFSPSLRSVTVVNTCNSSGLYVFHPFSTNPQFFIIGFQEMMVPPGGMISISVVFLPRILGPAQGLLVMQTSAAEFLVQIQGEGIKSPYLLEPLSGISSVTGTNLQHRVDFYNPHDEPLHIEEEDMWISGAHKSSLNHCSPERGKIRVVCKKDAVMSKNKQRSEDGLDWNASLANAESSNNLEDSVIVVRPSDQWRSKPHDSISTIDLQALGNEKGLGRTVCANIYPPSQQAHQTVPLDVQSRIFTSNMGKLHAIPEVLDLRVLIQREQKSKQVINMVNTGPDTVRVDKIFSFSEDNNIVNIDYAEGLILHPGTERQIAIITYVGFEQRTALRYIRCLTTDFCSKFKLLIQTNSSTEPIVEIPYQDLVFRGSNESFIVSPPGVPNGGASEAASFNGPCKSKHHFQPWKDFSMPLQLFRELRRISWNILEQEVELQPRGTALDHDFSNGQPIFGEAELLFSIAKLGMQSKQWINVRNPSNKPVLIKVMVSPEATGMNCISDHSIDRCSFGSLEGQEKVRNLNGIFTIASGWVVDAVVQPKGKAALGPIIFCPVGHSLWSSFIMISNNLIGMEWMLLQGRGASTSLTFLDDDYPVHVLQLDFILTTVTLPMIRTVKQHIYGLFNDKSVRFKCYKSISREILVKNTGDMPIHVEGMTMDGICGSHGFKLGSCDGFYLASGQTAQLLISYQPDLTGAFQRDLQLATSTGSITIPLRANLPVHILFLCHKASPFSKFGKLVSRICLLAIFFLLVVFMKVLKLERLVAIEPRHWPLKNHAISRSVGLKSTGKECQNLKDVKFWLFRIHDIKNASELGRPAAGGIERNDKSLNFLGAIATKVGVILSRIRSVVCSQDSENFPDIKVNISNFRGSVSGLTNFDKADTHQGDCFSLNCSKAADKREDAAHSASHLSKIGCPLVVMDVCKLGFNSTTEHEVAGDKVTVTESSKKQPLRSGSPLLLAVGSPKSSPSEEILPAQVGSLKSQSLSYKPHSLSSKTGFTEKEKKDKGKRKKRRNNSINMKQELECVCVRGYSSPSPPPASPATPVNSSRPVSPFLLPDSSLRTSMEELVPSLKCSTDSADDGATCQFTKEVQPQVNSVASYATVAPQSPSKIGQDPMSSMKTCRVRDAACTLLQDISISSGANSLRSPLSDSADERMQEGSIRLSGHASKGKQELNCRYAPKDRGSVAGRATVTTNGSDTCEKGHLLKTSNINRSSNNSPVLTTSATFPRGSRTSEWNLPILEEENQTLSFCLPSRSLISSSIIPPNARAPGTRVSKQRSQHDFDLASGCQERGSVEGSCRFYGDSMCSPSDTKITEEGDHEFVYDIWGYHFAEINCSTVSSGSMASTAMKNNLATNKCLQNSQSLFAKSEFMMNLGTHHVPEVPSNGISGGSEFSVFSTIGSNLLEASPCAFPLTSVAEQDVGIP